MKWRVEIWKRSVACSLDSRAPARYELFWEGSIEADASVVAMSRAAEGRKLAPTQWTGVRRPPYVVRVLGTLA